MTLRTGIIDFYHSDSGAILAWWFNNKYIFNEE
jgi:hypothetical protein